MIISKCSYLICCKRQIQKPINVFFPPFVPHKAVQFPSVYTMSDLHCQLSSYLMVEYHVSAHMIATASNSTTAKSFLDSCLLCTSPKYYHIWRPLIACEYSHLSFAPATTCESRRVVTLRDSHVVARANDERRLWSQARPLNDCCLTLESGSLFVRHAMLSSKFRG